MPHFDADQIASPSLDRRADLRSDVDALEICWADGLLVRLTSSGSLRLNPLGVACAGRFDPARHVFLGRWRERWWFAERVEEADGAAEALGDDLRRSTLPDLDTEELVFAAQSVLVWHDSRPRCERCHATTHVAQAGWVRICDACGALAFPRNDPAMIVAVLDDENRLLLAHQELWGPGRVSILAGFVEAGESAEHAVVREVAEEVGLRVTRCAFVASRPWPFPRSLMLGFVARATGDIAVDGDEISWAQWYTRDELERAEAAGEVSLPGPNSISIRLINAWRDGVIERWLDLPDL